MGSAQLRPVPLSLCSVSISLGNIPHVTLPAPPPFHMTLIFQCVFSPPIFSLIRTSLSLSLSRACSTAHAAEGAKTNLNNNEQCLFATACLERERPWNYLKPLKKQKEVRDSRHRGSGAVLLTALDLSRQRPPPLLPLMVRAARAVRRARTIQTARPPITARRGSGPFCACAVRLC